MGGEQQGRQGAHGDHRVNSTVQRKIQLDFEKPFPSSNVTDFILWPSGDQTNVTWAMSGPSSFIVKFMGIFMSMDRMIGKDFEEGLFNLKRVAEA